MGIIDSIKSAIGVGSTREISESEISNKFEPNDYTDEEGGYDNNYQSGSNDYRELQNNEVRDEGFISHDEGRMKDVSRDKYYVERAIANRPENERKRTAKRNKEIIQETASSAVGYAGRGLESAGRAVVSGAGRGLEKVKEKAGEVYEYSVSPHIPRPLETMEEKHKRLRSENELKFERETTGMSKHERNVYKDEKERHERLKAREKAQKKYPATTTIERKQKQQTIEAEERKVRQAYRLAKAKKAGAYAGTPPKQSKEKKDKGQSPATRPASSIGNPAMTQGSERLIPHGFMPQGGYAPGFNDYQGGINAPGFGSPNRMRPVGFEQPQFPPAPEPQPERRMTRREMHKQQARQQMQSQIQQQQETFVPEFFRPPQPQAQQDRNQSQQPRYKNLFEREDFPKPTMNGNGNKKGSKQQSQQFYNPFDTHQMSEHNPLMQPELKGKQHQSELANASASLLGIGSFGTNNSKGNKKSKRGVAPWEL